MAAKTMKEIEKFFDDCVNFWEKRVGNSHEVALCKAIWWDCAECWNIDKSWDDNRIGFINRHRSYKPYDPIPDEKLIESGKA